MRVLMQRVTSASVAVAGVVSGVIDEGLVLLVGVAEGDCREDAERLAAKIVNLRIFNDENGKFNRSLLTVGGGALVISQFTLFADTRKGRRPSFIEAARPEAAQARLADLVAALRAAGVSRVEEGVFGANMDVALVNQGPVTIWLDSRDLAR
jgi:D-tyrosyl-tRNA(Tyr) deacylase